MISNWILTQWHFFSRRLKIHPDKIEVTSWEKTMVEVEISCSNGWTAVPYCDNRLILHHLLSFFKIENLCLAGCFSTSETHSKFFNHDDLLFFKNIQENSKATNLKYQFLEKSTSKRKNAFENVEIMNFVRPPEFPIFSLQKKKESNTKKYAETKPFVQFYHELLNYFRAFSHGSEKWFHCFLHSSEEKSKAENILAPRYKGKIFEACKSGKAEIVKLQLRRKWIDEQ